MEILKSNRKNEGRLTVLISAFACEADEGSEPQVGWRWANLMADDFNVVVLTQKKNQPRIEDWLENHPEDRKGIVFEYFELGSTWRSLKRRFSWMMHPYYLFWQIAIGSKIRKLIFSHQIDVLHHVTYASFRLPVFIGGKPIVWGPVGGADLAPSRLVFYRGTIFGGLRELIRNVHTKFAYWLIPWLNPIEASGGIVFASTPKTREVLEARGVECELMPTIGLEAECQQVPEREISSGPLRLLYVGRLHQLKGLQLVIDAMAGIKERHIQLTVLGDGPAKRTLQKLVNALNLTDQVDFVGLVPRADLKRWHDLCDVLVAPSLYESGGLSVLEAFAEGIPSIVLKKGGHAMSVADGCGIAISPEGSPREIVARLEEAIITYDDDRERIVEDGKRAFTHLKLNCGWDVKRKRMAEAYQRIVALKP